MANTSSSFDLSTAVPVEDTTPDAFDLKTAKPDDSDTGRQAALIGRAASQGVIGALTLPNTIGTAASNVPLRIANFFGGHYPLHKNVSEMYSDAMTKLGAPVPETSGEQLAGAGVSGLTGGLAGGGLAGLPGIANTVRSGASGATAGLSQEGARQVGLPTWMQIGAGLLGGQSPAFLESTGQTIGNLVKPLTASGQRQAIGTLLNQKANDPVKALAAIDATTPIVPGSNPTTGAASQDIGLLGIEKYARGQDATAFGTRASEQNLARQNELGSIAGTEKALELAIKARGDSTRPLYDAAGGVSVKSNSDLAAILARPSATSAWNRAQKLAEEDGRPLVAGVDMPAQTVDSPLLSALSGNRSGVPFSTTTPAQSATYSGRGIQYLKMGLNDIADTGPQKGMGAHELRAVKSTLGDLNDWIGSNVPALKTADTAYAAQSTPITRMQTLQDLQQRSNMTASDPSTGQYFLSPAAFNRGLSRVQEDPMNGVTAADHARLGGLLQDLENSQAINGPLLKAPGSDTFQNLSLRQNMGGLASIAGKPLDWLYNLAGSDKAIQGLLTQSMLDPKFAAALMRNVKKPMPGPSYRPYATQSETAYDAGAMGGLFGAVPR